MKFDYKGSALLALPVTAAVWVVSWLFGLLNIGDIQNLFVSVPATSVVSGTVGQKVLGFIGGVLPFHFDLMTFVYVFVSAWVAILLGTLLVGWFKLPNIFPSGLLKGNAGKVASVLIWGAVPFYLILNGFKLPSLMTIIGILIHTYLVAFVALWVASLINLKLNY
ncbi:MAG: hypothetical protein KKB31_00420 [Nanoarchaeota archaeon]|nr:hypothetical protein [Nanoarchaeota archaeon]